MTEAIATKPNVDTISISSESLDLLKNFATINSNILIEPGNVIRTISPFKNIVAEATVPESFSHEVGIWDLNQFLGVVSLFDTPELKFQEKLLEIQSDKSTVEYFYSPASLLTTTNKQINMPPGVVEFFLEESVLQEIAKAASVLQVPDLKITKSGEKNKVILTVLDRKNDTSNTFSRSVEFSDANPNSDFEFYFKIENLKLIQGSYNVVMTEKVVAQFSHDVRNLKYWVALETGSKYNANDI